MQAILIGILTQIVGWAIEKLGAFLFALIERYNRNSKIEGQAKSDFEELKKKKIALDLATGENRAKAQADFLSAASMFGRIRL